MTIINGTRLGLRPGIMLLALSLLNAACASVFATEEAIAPGIPDAVVWVDAGTPGAHRLSITYSQIVERSRAEAHLNKLLSDTGWIPLGVEISEDSVMESGDYPMTAIEMVVPEIVRMDSGTLPLEPVITALKDLPSLMILFMVPPNFSFRGLEDFENRHVDIRFQESTSTYQYAVTVKSADFEALGLPSFGPRAEVVEENRRSGLIVHPIFLAVVLALVAAVFAYFMTSRATGRGARNRDQRS